MDGLSVSDDVLADPWGYRAACLRQPFRSVTLGEQTFHGIASPPDDALVRWILEQRPDFDPRLTFLRLSLVGQVEPNAVHDDRLMGQQTGIFYLQPEPPAGDGTV